MKGYIIPLLFFIVVAVVVIMKRSGASIPNPHLGTKLKNMDWGWVKSLGEKKWVWAAGLIVLVHLMLLFFANAIYLAVVGQMWIWALSVAGIILLAIADKSGKMVKAARIVLVSVVLISVASGFVSGDIPLPDFGKEKRNGNTANVVASNGPAVIVGQPAKLEFDPAERLPTETARLIDERFSDFGGDTALVMKRIAYAESRGKQWAGTEGEELVVLQNKNTNGTTDNGLFQINSGVTGEICEKQGFNYMTLEGNLDCGAYLVRHERGFDHWSASAWLWRDNYSSKPGEWSFDRTPEQIVAATEGRDEVVILTAPPTDWSEAVRSYNRFYCIRSVGEGGRFKMVDETGLETIFEPGGIVDLERYAKSMKFQSLEGYPITVTFRRQSGACSAQ